jgi:hypothetical protein
MGRPLSLLALAPVGVSLFLVTGCAELRSDFVPATGAPLAVFDRTETRIGHRTVATGQDVIRDRSGRRVGTSTHYERRAYAYDERVYYPIQGGQRVDDESFFRITQDVDAAQQYDDWHRAGQTKVTAGWVLLGLGLGLIGGAVASFVMDTPRTEDGERGLLSTLAYIGGGVGLSLATIGGYTMASGYSQASSKDARIIKDPDRMHADAERYNAAHGHATDPDPDPAPVVPPPEAKNDGETDAAKGWPWNIAQTAGATTVR